MFANAVYLFCRSVGVSAAQTEVKKVRVSVSSYHIRFVIFSSIDRLSYFSIVIFATASAVSLFCGSVDVNGNCDHRSAAG